jgi:sporulation protein YlmC with PRC-barrel domain
MDMPRLLSASTMTGDRVVNSRGEELGKLEELMIDLDNGCVGYAVLSFGGVLGIGDKLFAIPWDAMRLDTDRKVLVLDVDRERLEDAPGFDKDNWPQTVNREWMLEVYRFYGSQPYWQERERTHR